MAAVDAAVDAVVRSYRPNATLRVLGAVTVPTTHAEEPMEETLGK